MASVSLQLALDNHQQEHRALYEQASRCYQQAKASQDAAMLNTALAYAQQARALKSDHIPTLNLLARIELSRHNYAAAELWVEQGLALKPQSVALLYSAGLIAFNQYQLNEAEQYFNEALKISRVATKALNSLAQVKLLQGDYVSAFQHFRELAKTQAQDIKVRSQLFQAASQIQADFYSEELEQDVLRYFEFEDVDHSQLRPLATSLLRHKLRLSEAGCPLELETIAADPLLLACLTKFYFTDPVFERLFITLRQSLLFSCSQTLSMAQAHVGLIEALAHQCWLNEAVYYVSENEQKLVNQLEQLAEKVLQLDQLGGLEAVAAMRLVLMYQPLSSCSFAPLLADKMVLWPEVISAQLEELQTLAAQQQKLISLGDSADSTSLKVQAQYNQHPYPRWHSIGFNEPADYASTLRQTFPQAANLLPAAQTGLEVLVAGCGTGRHAIRLAKYFPSLKITALDLSHTALAYAMQMAQRYQEPSIRFVQGDLLDCAKLEQRFDVIECSGVLHHMLSPVTGLKALSAQLKPGGLMKIALYSRTARTQITELRVRLAGHLPHTVDDMRLMREALLQNAISGDWQSLFNSPDFYSTSACRDLIFHTQEHCFDVRELPEFLSQAGLQWLGMLAPDAQEIVRLAGLPAHEISIEHWHLLEQAKPDLFAGMYQFYAIKPH